MTHTNQIQLKRKRIKPNDTELENDQDWKYDHNKFRGIRQKKWPAIETYTKPIKKYAPKNISE